VRCLVGAVPADPSVTVAPAAEIHKNHRSIRGAVAAEVQMNHTTPAALWSNERGSVSLVVEIRRWTRLAPLDRVPFVGWEGHNGGGHIVDRCDGTASSASRHADKKRV